MLHAPLPALSSERRSVAPPRSPRWNCNAVGDLEPLVRRGRLRRELYHRRAVVRLHESPLRMRRADLSALVADVIAGRVHSSAAAFIVAHPDARLPLAGNVREMEAILTQAAWRARESVLHAADLGDLLTHTVLNAAVSIPLGTSLAVAEQALVQATLAGFDGNKKRTAEALGIARRTLYLKLGRR